MSDDLLLERREWESDQMYALRTKFIQKYRCLPIFVANPSRLDCFAQLLVNLKFLKCTYDERLTKQILDMEQYLDSDQPYNSADVCSDTLNSQHGINNGTKRNKRCADDSSLVVQERDDFVKRKSDDLAPEKSITHQKLETILSVRAQLCNMLNDRSLQPVEMMNQACQSCKVQWRVDFTTEDELTLCKLTIDHVLALQLLHYSADQCKVRNSACQKIVDLLRNTEKISVLLDDAEKTFKLFYTYKDPTYWQYDVLTNGLKSLGIYLRENKEKIYEKVRKSNKNAAKLSEDSLNVLRLACEQFFKESGLFEVRKKHVEGWSEDAIVRVCKVEVGRLRLQRKSGDHQIQLDSISSLCADCIENMSKFDRYSLFFKHEDNVCKVVSSSQAASDDLMTRLVEKMPNYEQIFADLRRNMPVEDKCPNAVARLFECASRCKLIFDCVDDSESDNRNQSEFNCEAILEDCLILARARHKKKKQAKLDACQKAINVILENDLNSIIIP